MRYSILPQLIGAIGADNFPAVAADALGRFLGFDLATVIVHRRAQRPAVLFDNFDRIGCRQGIENYVCFTHRINPMLARAPATGAYRACDFVVNALRACDDVGTRVVLEAAQAIALRLDISRHTVKDHRKAIFRKLRIGSLAELFALRGRGC